MRRPANDWYRVGDRIVVTASIMLAPYGVIMIGELGTVAFVDTVSLYTEILMDKTLSVLRDWDNHLWLIPPDTDEIERAVTRISSEEPKWLRQSS